MIFCFSRLRVYIVLLALCLASMFAAGVESTADAKPGSIQYRRCAYTDIAQGKVSCARFTTPATQGRFELPVAIVHATPGKRAGEALVLIPGGPGEGFQLAEWNVEYWLEWMRETGLSRDLVLYDPRGAGESSSSWYCEEYDTKSLEWIGQNLDIKTELEISHPVLRNCLHEYDRWLKQNVDVSIRPHPGVGLLSSLYQAEDINALLGALGYDAWHLWGVSYGTRVALLAARHDKVKTVLLDSPYPLDKGKLSEWPALLNGALEKHREIYQALYSSEGKYPDFQTLWKKVIYRLDRSPAVLHVQRRGSEDDKPLTLVLNSDRLTSLAYYVLYDTSLWLPFYEGLEFLQSDSKSPGSIAREAWKKVAGALKASTDMAEKSDSLALVLESFATSSFDPLFNTMVYFAVECVDNTIDTESAFNAELEKYPHLSRYARHDWQYDICRDPLFDKQRNPVARRELTTTKPTLILNGQYDPVTPVDWGLALQRQLGKLARFHQVGGAGHAVTVGDICSPGLFEDFMNGSDINLQKVCEDIDLTWSRD